MRFIATDSRDTDTLGELEILRRLRRRNKGTSSASLRLGIGDDCALLRIRPGEELAVTTDLSVAGRHFQLGWHPPEAVGHRTLARGLSDLAAMGARPIAAFLSLGLPRELTTPNRRIGSRSVTESWIERFLDGFQALAKAYKTPLAGGDLAESPLPTADVVLIGAVPRNRALLRSGAHPGDALYVTGSLGGSAVGLAILAKLADHPTNATSLPPPVSKKMAAQLVPHLYPQPRVSQGLWLMRRRIASAAIDLSDGLSSDLTHICNESGVAAEVNADSLPIHSYATEAQALHGGEDYELLFTALPAARVPRSIAGVPVTAIGRIVRPRRGRPQVALTSAHGVRPLVARGWEHFS
jgi:thiamine-monophosphate kinase